MGGPGDHTRSSADVFAKYAVYYQGYPSLLQDPLNEVFIRPEMSMAAYLLRVSYLETASISTAPLRKKTPSRFHYGSRPGAVGSLS